MFIRVGYEIDFDIPAPVAMRCCCTCCPTGRPTCASPDRLRVEPDVPLTEFIDWFGNRCARLTAPAGPLRLCNDFMVEDSGLPASPFPDAVQHPVARPAV